MILHENITLAIEGLVREATASKAKWLEHWCARLIKEGHDLDDVEIVESNCTTVIYARGRRRAMWHFAIDATASTEETPAHVP